MKIRLFVKDVDNFKSSSNCKSFLQSIQDYYSFALVHNFGLHIFQILALDSLDSCGHT